MSSTCGACRHHLHREIDEDILRGELRGRIARRYALSRDQVDAHAMKHVPSMWERCRVCALQMTSGPRCMEHNPTPEVREEQEKVKAVAHG